MTPSCARLPPLTSNVSPTKPNSRCNFMVHLRRSPAPEDDNQCHRLARNEDQECPRQGVCCASGEGAEERPKIVPSGANRSAWVRIQI